MGTQINNSFMHMRVVPYNSSTYDVGWMLITHAGLPNQPYVSTIAQFVSSSCLGASVFTDHKLQENYIIHKIFPSIVSGYVPQSGNC